MLSENFKTKLWQRLSTMPPGRYPIDTTQPNIDDVIEAVEQFIAAQYKLPDLPERGIELTADYTAINCVDLTFRKQRGMYK